MLRYVLQKGFWYLLTFVVAVAINFTLPRMGENNPVDIIMGKAAQGLSPEEAKLKKEGLDMQSICFLSSISGQQVHSTAATLQVGQASNFSFSHLSRQSTQNARESLKSSSKISSLFLHPTHFGGKKS